MKDGWKMVIASLGVVLYMKIDQVMITRMLGAEENGVYSVAVGMSEIWYFIPTVICNTVYPAFVDVAGDDKAYKARFLKMFDLMFVISAVILVGTLLLSGWFISTFFGKAYEAAVPCLYIHIFGIIFVFLGIAASKWVLTEGKLIYTSIRTMFAAIVNIVLNYLLMDDYGIQGAAAATVVSQVLSSYLFYLFIPRYRGLFVLQTKAMILPLRAAIWVFHGRKTR
jgi:O-antigen/teichoic acid export membrane protein